MFAFKVMVSTILLFMVLIIAYAAFSMPKKSKVTAIMIIIVYGLCFIAIWG